MTLNIQEYCRRLREKANAINLDNVSEHILGLDCSVSLMNGGRRRFINLDNAATTPPFDSVLHCMTEFFRWYASIHRGSGFKSLLSTHVYSKCREVVADFIGAETSCHTIVFTQNATHALNKLAMRLPVTPDCVIITTGMEHHSNLLPWRKLGCSVEMAAVNPIDGRLDMADLRNRIRINAGKLALVTVCGASNVTGVMPAIRAIARLAHENGALFAVDAAQMLPHRAFKMGAPDDPERIDFAAFSAHKMYAPFGSGALVGPKSFFEAGAPDIVGGGTIEGVTQEEVIWAGPPEKDEAGTPNLPGAFALANVIEILDSIGMDNIAEHERELTSRLIDGLSRIPGIKLYGSSESSPGEDRIGCIPFNIEGIHHSLVGAALGYEWGIGIRTGCFCAQPYVRSLLNVTDIEMKRLMEKMASGEHEKLPGMVRASLGVYNHAEDIDYLIEGIRKIATDGPQSEYETDLIHKHCVPKGCDMRLDEFVPFRNHHPRG